MIGNRDLGNENDHDGPAWDLTLGTLGASFHYETVLRAGQSELRSTCLAAVPFPRIAPVGPARIDRHDPFTWMFRHFFT